MSLTWDSRSNCIVIWIHPQLLKEKDVVVTFGDSIAYGFDSLLLELTSQRCRHSPRIERHNFKSLAVMAGAFEVNEVNGKHMPDDNE